MNKSLLRMLLALLGVVLVALALAAVLFFRPVAVTVVQPAENVAVEVFGLGTVEARIISEVGFDVGATLVELHADHGERVQQGAILARLDSAEQAARVTKARAGVVNAQAAMKKAEAALGKAQVVLAQRQQNFQRKQTLLQKQTVSAEVAEEAEMERDVAAAELAVARSELDVARAALEDARAQLAYEQLLLEQHTLKSPYNAEVVARHKELGSVLLPGEPLFTLVVPETVWVRAYIDEARAGEIRVGQSAEVRLRSLSRQSFPAHVARIDIESDRVSEERRVYVSCDRCPERFHLGEQAEVLITTGVLDQAVLVPEVAVDGFDHSTGTVWTVEGGELQRRRVDFGQRTLDSRLEIVAGLPDGARVLKALPDGLRPGRAARIVEAEGAP